MSEGCVQPAVATAPGAVPDRSPAAAVSLLVNIDVDDLPRAVGFYTEAFGLRPGRRFGDAGVELLGAASPLYLLLKAAGSRPADSTDERRHYGRHWTPVHLDFVVPDIAHALQKAEAAGARVEQAVQTNAWGRLALLSDPFGNGFCLVEFIGRGYDEIAQQGPACRRDSRADLSDED